MKKTLAAALLAAVAVSACTPAESKDPTVAAWEQICTNWKEGKEGGGKDFVACRISDQPKLVTIIIKEKEGSTAEAQVKAAAAFMMIKGAVCGKTRQSIERQFQAIGAEYPVNWTISIGTLGECQL